MWAVLRKEFKSDGPVVVGQTIIGKMKFSISRVVDSLDEVDSGELFIKCNVKK
jgi:hypothetical protein